MKTFNFIGSQMSRRTRAPTFAAAQTLTREQSTWCSARRSGTCLSLQYSGSWGKEDGWESKGSRTKWQDDVSKQSLGLSPSRLGTATCSSVCVCVCRFETGSHCKTGSVWNSVCSLRSFPLRDVSPRFVTLLQKRISGRTNMKQNWSLLKGTLISLKHSGRTR